MCYFLEKFPITIEARLFPKPRFKQGESMKTLGRSRPFGGL
jgi:hypothetical protein